ncbi:MAG: dihydropteroate synthase, partial [Pseudomonadota bacterium]
DAYDEELLAIAKGGMPEIVSLVHRMMDGEEPDLKTLSPKEVEYAKTMKVLLGKSLYSHSWLEL